MVQLLVLPSYAGGVLAVNLDSTGTHPRCPLEEVAVVDDALAVHRRGNQRLRVAQEDVLRSMYKEQMGGPVVQGQRTLRPGLEILSFSFCEGRKIIVSSTCWVHWHGAYSILLDSGDPPHWWSPNMVTVEFFRSGGYPSAPLGRFRGCASLHAGPDNEKIASYHGGVWFAAEISAPSYTLHGSSCTVRFQGEGPEDSVSLGLDKVEVVDGAVYTQPGHRLIARLDEDQ
jgi:hypothetical protein